MPEITLKARIQNKYDSLKNWNNFIRGEFIPLAGEVCYALEDNMLYQKIGDGVTDFVDLPWLTNQGDWNENNQLSPSYIKNRIGGYYQELDEEQEFYHDTYTPTLLDTTSVFEVEYADFVERTKTLTFSTSSGKSYKINSVQLTEAVNIEGADFYYGGNSRLAFQALGLSEEEILALGVKPLDTKAEWSILSNVAGGYSFVVITGTWPENTSLSITGKGVELIRIPEDYYELDMADFVGQFDPESNGGEIFNDYVNNKATGAYSSAKGSNCQATGGFSIASGIGSIASGSTSFAHGHICQANGNSTVALGDQAEALAENSIAIGYHAKGEGLYSMALGQNSQVQGMRSIGIFGNTIEDDQIAICGSAKSNDKLVLGNRLLTVDKQGNTTIAKNLTADSYIGNDKYRFIDDSVITINKYEISSLHPYIINNSNRECIISGKNLWPMYKFSNSGSIVEDFEFSVDKNNGSIMIRKNRDVNQDKVFAATKFLLKQGETYTFSFDLESQSLGEDYKNIYIKVQIGEEVQIVKADQPVTITASLEPSIQNIAIVIPTTVEPGTFYIKPMIGLGTHKAQFTRPINFILNPQESFNINNCDYDIITVRVSETGAAECKISYLPQNRTPSENLIGNLVQNISHKNFYHFNLNDEDKIRFSIADDGSTLEVYSHLGIKLNDEWYSFYKDISPDQLKIVDNYDASSLFADQFMGGWVIDKCYFKDNVNEFTLSVADMEAILTQSGVPFTSTGGARLIKTEDSDNNQCCSLIYYAQLQSEDFSFDEFGSMNEFAFELPPIATDIYLN